MTPRAIIFGKSGNLFLDSLPSAVRDAMLPGLTKVELRQGAVLARPGQQLDHVYFPIRSVISTVTSMEDGNAVEVGIAGREGFSALILAFGSRTSPHTTTVQIADSAYCFDADEFDEMFRTDAQMRDRVLAYANYVFSAATQFAACNRLHPVEERYARWLLTAEDRVGPGEFFLTQEFAAQMLGVRRAGVTVVAGRMSEAGLIAYRRGHINVLDRQGLEDASCECYRAVNAELKRLMGYDVRPAADPSRDGVAPLS